MNFITAAMAESSEKLGRVALSAGEMRDTINDIARHSQQAGTITKEAVSQAEKGCLVW